MACCFPLTRLQSLLRVAARVVLLRSDVDPPDFMMPRGTVSPGGLGRAPVKLFSQNLRASLPSFCLTPGKARGAMQGVLSQLFH